MGVVATGCNGSTTTSEPDDREQNAAAVSVEQPALPTGVLISRDPMADFRSGLYTLLRKNRTDPVELAGYRQQLSSDGKQLRVNSFSVSDGAWTQIPTAQLVWSPNQQGWVESDRSETLSAGPDGSRGWPTVKGVADWGTTYYTIGYREVGGQNLANGLPAGFAEGAALPAAASTARFSPDARAFFLAATSVEPVYVIARVRQVDTGQSAPRLVYACGQAEGDCANPATDLKMATEQRGKFVNAAGNASIELRSKHNRAIMKIEGTPVLDVLTYTITEGDGPARITFAPLDDEKSNERFEKAFGSKMANFAFFDYDGKVVVGGIQPAGTTRSDDAVFNRAAVNDLLTQWTPGLPPVGE
ncbi:hypothetical protein BVU76_14135 [Mycolicibacterium porcinum]|nr:hypothetical protein BVU76_14135 [Mycolicibacterium porcinum]